MMLLCNVSQRSLYSGIIPASILYQSIAGRYRPVSYPDGPITARYRFINNAQWDTYRMVCDSPILLVVHIPEAILYGGYVSIKISDGRGQYIYLNDRLLLSGKQFHRMYQCTEYGVKLQEILFSGEKKSICLLMN